MTKKTAYKVAAVQAAPEFLDLRGSVDKAITLIEQNAGPFDSEQYKDTYSADLLKIIKQKAKGRKPKKAKVEEAPDKTIDLMAKLKASLEKSNKKVS